MNSATDESEVVRRAMACDQAALNDLLTRYRARLVRMVALRINRRLQGRVDPSDVVQEAYLEASRVLHDYRKEPALPFYLWLRRLTGEKLIQVHRRHLGAQVRAADREVSLHRGALPEATSESLAAQLLGRFPSPSEEAIRAETKLRLQEALNSMAPVDREILALRHFEQLTGPEAAQVLGITHAAAKKRYVRAIERLQQILADISGMR